MIVGHLCGAETQTRLLQEQHTLLATETPLQPCKTFSMKFHGIGAKISIRIPSYSTKGNNDVGVLKTAPDIHQNLQCLAYVAL